MSNNINDNLPQTIREVGIYLGQMSEQLNSIDKKLNDSVSREEFNELKEDVCSIHNFIDSITKKVAGAFITMLALMILAQYGINQFLR